MGEMDARGAYGLVGCSRISSFSLKARDREIGMRHEDRHHRASGACLLRNLITLGLVCSKGTRAGCPLEQPWRIRPFITD